jgi:xylono-1,5-lactonase
VNFDAGSASASNGLDSSPDGRGLFHADTFAGTVTRYPDSVPIARADRPDGLAVDAEGCVWVALWGSGEVCRYTADGALDRRLRVPAPLVTNLAFGGPDLATLFVTTARSDGAESSGAVFAGSVGVTGLPAAAFGI